MEWREDELPEHCQKQLAEAWDKISSQKKLTWEQILETTPKLLCDKEREILNNSWKNNLARKNSEFDEKNRLKENENMYDLTQGRKRHRHKTQWQNKHLGEDYKFLSEAN